jgi:hypothetical protein
LGFTVSFSFTAIPTGLSVCAVLEGQKYRIWYNFEMLIARNDKPLHWVGPDSRAAQNCSTALQGAP